MPTATTALLACSETTPSPNRGSILPEFTPSHPCELENAFNRVEFCTVQASPELSYPCSQTESAQEIVIGRKGEKLLIQRDYDFNSGCWQGRSYHKRSLRVCDSGSGATQTFAEDVIGEVIPSPDGTQLAFVAAEPGSHRLKVRLFRVGLDGSELIQLDMQPFPQDQVVGAQILRWSNDGEWVEVSLWDGREGGNHLYRIRSDGSGEFVALP